MNVRGGGLATEQGYLYELTGGSLCLDFANTVDDRRSAEPRELVGSYADLLAWAEQAGALEGSLARRLLKRSKQNARQAQAVLGRGRRLREAIFRVFSAVAAGDTPPRGALHLINEQLPTALARLRVAPRGDGFDWDWGSDGELDRVLWPVLRSSADLLTSEDLDRVRECAADTCGWLFLDQSRNRSRRWCDMSVCGNRSKVRRFRDRNV